MRDKPFLGTGWSFPPTFTLGGKTLEVTSGTEDIDKSLEILLSTRLGERVMQARYGCNLETFVFESINESFLTYINHLVENAIIYYEPRIVLQNINVDSSRSSEGILFIDITYQVRETNVPHNYVFPFYLDEGLAPRP